MIRTHGYSEKGKRCIGTHDWHKKGRVNAIGAQSGTKFLTICLFNGSINSHTFHGWIEQDLLPKLPAKSVLLMDNATFHKKQETLDLIENNGYSVIFLPPYSPDYNPIEKMWALAKSVRRKIRCNTEELFERYLSSHFITC